MGYFGIPFRNGVPIGLGSVVSFGAQQFDPSELFVGGTAGAWYDPSDLTTLFTTSAGTTPVAMPGQGSAVSVGLMLDKSQGLVLGSELSNPATQTFGTATGTQSGAGWNVTATGAFAQLLQTGVLTAGRWYKVRFKWSGNTNGRTIRFLVGGTAATYAAGTGASGDVTFYITASTNTSAYFQINDSVNGDTFYLEITSVRELPGNHAIAFNNTTARPELRARVNLLTYSEEFNVAPWTNLNAVSITANSITAPDGTLTADTITENTVNTSHFIRTEAQLAVASTAYTFSLYVKNNNADYITLAARGASSNYIAATFTLTGSGAVTSTSAAGAGYAVTVGSTTITSVGNGWFRCVLSGTMGANVSSQSFFVALSDGVSAYGSDGIMVYTGTSRSAFIWGADLRPANIGANVPAYQRIADANTYDTSGFPLYLRFDGIDDSMYTPANLNLSGTDKVAVFAGVRRLANAADEAVTEFSAAWSVNNGAFIFANVASGSQYSFDARGTSSGFNAVGTYAPPITSVRTGLANIGASTSVQRVNGVQVSAPAVTLGTGNFGTYPLYIGARNNSSLWFNGHLHSLIIAGSAVSAGNISATEQWVAGKTGITI